MRSLPLASQPWTPTLAAAGEFASSSGLDRVEHYELSSGAWVQHLPEWLAGSATAFEELLQNLAWREPDVLMYGRRLRQPRLSAWLGETDLSSLKTLPETGPGLQAARAELVAHYGVALRTTGCNLYRNGADSVAWHGDSGARQRLRSMVAIISLGARRPFRLRPAGGGEGLTFHLGHGDLLVMGGTCQRTWQHSVPKIARASARISVTFRQHAERPAPLRLPR